MQTLSDFSFTLPILYTINLNCFLMFRKFLSKKKKNGIEWKPIYSLRKSAIDFFKRFFCIILNVIL